jgi:hypothetical protein
MYLRSIVSSSTPNEMIETAVSVPTKAQSVAASSFASPT